MVDENILAPLLRGCAIKARLQLLVARLSVTETSGKWLLLSNGMLNTGEGLATMMYAISRYIFLFSIVKRLDAQVWEALRMGSSLSFKPFNLKHSVTFSDITFL